MGPFFEQFFDYVENTLFSPSTISHYKVENKIAYIYHITNHPVYTICLSSGKITYSAKRISVEGGGIVVTNSSKKLSKKMLKDLKLMIIKNKLVE